MVQDSWIQAGYLSRRSYKTDMKIDNTFSITNSSSNITDYQRLENNPSRCVSEIKDYNDSFLGDESSMDIALDNCGSRSCLSVLVCQTDLQNKVDIDKHHSICSDNVDTDTSLSPPSPLRRISLEQFIDLVDMNDMLLNTATGIKKEETSVECDVDVHVNEMIVNTTDETVAKQNMNNTQRKRHNELDTNLSSSDLCHEGSSHLVVKRKCVSPNKQSDLATSVPLCEDVNIMDVSDEVQEYDNSNITKDVLSIYEDTSHISSVSRISDARPRHHSSPQTSQFIHRRDAFLSETSSQSPINPQSNFTIPQSNFPILQSTLLNPQSIFSILQADSNSQNTNFERNKNIVRMDSHHSVISCFEKRNADQHIQPNSIMASGRIHLQTQDNSAHQVPFFQGAIISATSVHNNVALESQHLYPTADTMTDTSTSPIVNGVSNYGFSTLRRPGSCDSCLTQQDFTDQHMFQDNERLNKNRSVLYNQISDITTSQIYLCQWDTASTTNSQEQLIPTSTSYTAQEVSETGHLLREQLLDSPSLEVNGHLSSQDFPYTSHYCDVTTLCVPEEDLTTAGNTLMPRSREVEKQDEVDVTQVSLEAVQNVRDYEDISRDSSTTYAYDNLHSTLPYDNLHSTLPYDNLHSTLPYDNLQTTNWSSCSLSGEDKDAKEHASRPHLTSNLETNNFISQTPHQHSSTNLPDFNIINTRYLVCSERNNGHSHRPISQEVQDSPESTAAQEKLWSVADKENITSIDATHINESYTMGDNSSVSHLYEGRNHSMDLCPLIESTSSDSLGYSRPDINVLDRYTTHENNFNIPPVHTQSDYAATSIKMDQQVVSGHSKTPVYDRGQVAYSDNSNAVVTRHLELLDNTATKPSCSMWNMGLHLSLPTVLTSGPSTSIAHTPDKAASQLMETKEEHNETGEITPMVKNKLKRAIISKRRKEGKGDIEIKFETPVRSEPTDEEKEKEKHRKELNKKAAANHRQRKKTQSRQFEQECQELTQRNSQLKKTITDMESRQRMMINLLASRGIKIPIFVVSPG